MALLKPPANGVTVRMYRQGHGDCFLLAFPRKTGTRPVYVLIDCGYKPGSPAFVHGDGGANHPIADTVEDIREATDGHLDLVIITHEHQDHLNGIWKATNPYFAGFTIDEAWMAWTEDPDDDLANELRRRHKDTLLGVLEARQRLALAVGDDDETVVGLDTLLSFEFGGDAERVSMAEMFAAAKDPAKSINKQSLKFIKDEAEKERGVSFLNPGDGPLAVPRAKGIRAYVLGPPRDEDLLVDEDPKSGEGFPDDDAPSFTFRAAASSGTGASTTPFSSRFAMSMEKELQEVQSFFSKRYGKDMEGTNDVDRVEVPDNAPWRRIEQEWLYTAEQLALQLNRGINNTSLVLAFELPKSKKVLLFAADAQRGNWISWTNNQWDDAGKTISVRDLLGRTVLYKVGHHGSHNATLAGTTKDEYANLSWMGTGTAAKEFCAMITAVNTWAVTKNNPPWRHPLPSIREALVRKTQGRVFQTDTPQLTKPEGVSATVWNAFLKRCKVSNPLYFDYQILDK